jgi:hypothetical protein
MSVELYRVMEIGASLLNLSMAVMPLKKGLARILGTQAEYLRRTTTPLPSLGWIA